MDSCLISKILGSFIGAVALAAGANLMSTVMVSAPTPLKPAYVVATADAPVAKAAVVEEKPLAVLLASADAQRGAVAFKACLACHTINKEGANKVGPNLYNVVGRARASAPNFKYSAAMKASAASAPNWEYEGINQLIKNPKAYIAGTAMAFAGIASADQRADIIAYLRAQADQPLPLP